MRMLTTLQLHLFRWNSRTFRRLRAELVFLHGLAADPGGHKLTTLWWRYKEAGTYPNTVEILNPNSLFTFLVMPRDAMPGQTINLILQATNDGVPPLTRYQRVVVTC